MSERFCSLALGIFLFIIALAIVGSCSAEDKTAGAGLIAHWKFAEGVGDVVKDFSGEGNNGTIVPANTPVPKWGTGDFAGSISFSGGNDHFVRIPPSASEIQMIPMQFPTEILVSVVLVLCRSAPLGALAL